MRAAGARKARWKSNVPAWGAPARETGPRWKVWGAPARETGPSRCLQRQLLERPPTGGCGALAHTSWGVAQGAFDEGRDRARPQHPDTTHPPRKSSRIGCTMAPCAQAEARECARAEPEGWLRTARASRPLAAAHNASKLTGHNTRRAACARSHIVTLQHRQESSGSSALRATAAKPRQGVRELAQRATRSSTTLHGERAGTTSDVCLNPNKSPSACDATHALRSVYSRDAPLSKRNYKASLLSAAFRCAPRARPSPAPNHYQRSSVCRAFCFGRRLATSAPRALAHAGARCGFA